MSEPPRNDWVTREWYKQLRAQRSLDEFELELFVWYMEESETMLARLVEEETRFMNDQLAAGSAEINESGFLATSYQARRVRYSHVIYLASMLETILKRECDRLRLALGEQSAPFSPAEIKGDQWSSKRKFLERFGHFKISDDVWCSVKKLTDVRNVLVHDNGAVGPAAAASLGGLTGIKITSGEIEVEPAFVKEALASVKAVTEYLQEKVDEVINRRLRPQQL